jgi:hypothetical protein
VTRRRRARWRPRAALALLASLAPAACGARERERLPECDDFLATLAQVVACDRTDELAKAPLELARRSMRDALDRLSGIGIARAPADRVGEARRACGAQRAAVVHIYEKVAPDCLR